MNRHLKSYVFTHETSDNEDYRVRTTLYTITLLFYSFKNSLLIYLPHMKNGISIHGYCLFNNIFHFS